jgi:hypothetical protein
MQDTSNILLYTAPSHRIGSRLKKSIQSISIDNNIIVVTKLEVLSQILHKPLNGVDAAVIFHATRKGMVDLLHFRDELLRLPVILILPDQKNETIANGHSFRPRFLSYMDSDFSDVRDVFQKILGKTRHPLSSINYCN